MNVKPRQRCINLACAIGGTPDTGDTARYWANGEEDRGSVNTGVARNLTTLAGGAAADYTVTNSGTLGLSVKPTRPGLYYVTASVGGAITGECSKLGISMDAADLTDAFVAATVGMRAYIDFDVNAEGGVGGEISCFIPITQAIIDNPATGFIRHMHDAPTGEFTVYFQIQRVGNFG